MLSKVLSVQIFYADQFKLALLLRRFFYCDILSLDCSSFKIGLSDLMAFKIKLVAVQYFLWIFAGDNYRIHNEHFSH